MPNLYKTDLTPHIFMQCGEYNVVKHIGVFVRSGSLSPLEGLPIRTAPL